MVLLGWLRSRLETKYMYARFSTRGGYGVAVGHSGTGHRHSLARPAPHAAKEESRRLQQQVQRARRVQLQGHEASENDDGSDEFAAEPRTGSRRQRPHRQERHIMSRGGVGARRGLLRLALGGHQAAFRDEEL